MNKQRPRGTAIRDDQPHWRSGSREAYSCAPFDSPLPVSCPVCHSFVQGAEIVRHWDSCKANVDTRVDLNRLRVMERAYRNERARETTTAEWRRQAKDAEGTAGWDAKLLVPSGLSGQSTRRR